jgi:hypothetical protein
MPGFGKGIPHELLPLEHFLKYLNLAGLLSLM